MILVESGYDTPDTFAAKILFAERLRASGWEAVVDEAGAPENWPGDLRFDAAGVLVRVGDVAPDRLVMIAAEAVSFAETAVLRALPQTITDAVAVGQFRDRMTRVAAGARIAHGTGLQPRVVDLARLSQRPVVPASPLPMFAVASEPGLAGPGRPRVILDLSPDLAADLQVQRMAAALSLSADMAFEVMAPETPELVPRWHSLGITAWRPWELAPHAVAARADVIVLGGTRPPDWHAGLSVIDLLARGGTVVDMTPEGAVAATGAPVLRGPAEIAALPEFLAGRVLPAIGQIRRTLPDNPWLAGFRFARLAELLGLPEPDARPAPRRRRRIVILPTNGIGLGHAARSCSVAAALPDPSRALFTAYPSCVGLIEARGFEATPLVGRTGEHTDRDAEDVLNHLRLNRVARAGDLFVFDGGFVFDSVVRLIASKGLKAVWVRRGLWQAGKDFATNLLREKVFSRVIVPGEAFPDLERPLSFGEKVHRVGPVVLPAPMDDAGRADLRARLAAALGIGFDTLIVSMLGAGVAADRTAEIHVVAQHAARRKGAAHLVVTWPGSAVDPALYRFGNTRVVRTHRAAEIAAAADVAVTAAGYNGFHEVLYNRVPAIFVPQMASFMDDQAARARAAEKRDLALAVQGGEVLMLDRALSDMIDGGLSGELRARLSGASLPAPGTGEAARIIAAEFGR